ncbi:MAG: TIGR02587 family membrane protein, partial [Leptolyngbya sp.]|nr:TIGR02587 family membrane protein [Leptolyngbya sp.]
MTFPNPSRTSPDIPDPTMWPLELQAVMRGAAGGFLFGVPLLYTVEVWAIGSSAGAGGLVAVLGATLFIAWLLTQVEGFRQTLSLHPLEAVMESVEAVGIGVICAALALVLLRRITLDTPLAETLGKLVFEAVPFSLGVALARSTFQGRRDRDRRTTAPLSRHFTSPTLATVRDALVDLDATLIGTVLIAFSIAPTEEVPLIASSLPSLWLLLIMAASLGLSYAIVFASGFADRSERLQRGLLFSPITETLVAYLVA